MIKPAGACAVFAAAFLVFCCAGRVCAALPEGALNLDEGDRVLVLAPHPGDEILGCAGIIQEAKEKNLPLRVVFLTYDDTGEAPAADSLLGVVPGEIVFLGYPDRTTFDIWCAHWNDRPPAQGPGTKAGVVPYSGAFRPGAVYKGEEIRDDLKAVISAFNPTRIFLPHPADHNQDHRAFYLFTRVALWDLKFSPVLHPYLIHYESWPRPRGYNSGVSLLFPSELIAGLSWQTAALSGARLARKYKALVEYYSRFAVSRDFLLSFVRANELFGDFDRVILLRDGPAARLISLNQGPEQAGSPFVAEQTIRLKGDDIVISFVFSRPLASGERGCVYLFGYRQDIPFSEMPKLCVEFNSRTHTALNQNRPMHENAVKLRRAANTLSIRVSKKVLWDPQRLLAGSGIHAGLVPLDLPPWRVIELADAGN